MCLRPRPRPPYNTTAALADSATACTLSCPPFVCGKTGSGVRSATTTDSFSLLFFVGAARAGLAGLRLQPRVRVQRSLLHQLLKWGCERSGFETIASLLKGEKESLQLDHVLRFCSGPLLR